MVFITKTISYAGVFYMGPSLQYESVKADNGDSYQTLSPRLTVGYGKKIQFPYYVAGELFAVAGNIQGHPSNSSLKNTPSVGASLLPGFMLDDHTFLYGRLGVISTHFSTANSYTWGGQVGFGIETAITDSWDIRSEYIFTQYGNINSNESSSIGAPHSNMIAIGLIHHFN